MGAKPTVIPSIFTAIDKVSGPMAKMERSVAGFATKAESALARSERSFRRIAPGLSEAGKEMLSFVGTAALVGSALAGISFSVDAITKYEDAVASFRTIVSDATDKEFAAYETKIGDVANTTRKSTIEVAQSFERIAGLNAEFAKTSLGLANVSQAAITLAKASRMDLEPATDSLVGIMNQFSLQAEQADRTINVLAAGQAVGAASIQQTAESFVNFGSVAAGANITLEESVALVQTLGKFSLFGAEAGTKLRGAVIKLQQANMGYQSGQFNINDALVEARKKIDGLRTAKEKDAVITKMFGLENVTAGRILLNNIDIYKGFVAGVTGTSEAQKAAEINSATLSVKLDELKARWVNLLTTNTATSKSLTIVKNVIGFVTDNLDRILVVGGAVLAFFAAWKASIILGTIAIKAYNIATGLMAGINGKLTKSIATNTAALNSYRAGLALSHPIGLAAIAVVGLGAAFMAASKKVTAQTVALGIYNDINSAVIDKTIDQRIEVEKLFRTIARGTKGTDEYNAAMRRLEELQPGIIQKHNLEKGSIENIAAAYKDLISQIEKKAQVEAAAELYKESVKERMQLESQVASQAGQSAFSQFIQGFYDYDNTLDRLKERLGEVSMREDQLRNKVIANEVQQQQTPVVSTKTAQAQTQAQMMTQTNNASLNLNINDPNNRTSIQGSVPSFVTVNTSTTRQ